MKCVENFWQLLPWLEPIAPIVINRNISLISTHKNKKRKQKLRAIHIHKQQKKVICEKKIQCVSDIIARCVDQKKVVSFEYSGLLSILPDTTKCKLLYYTDTILLLLGCEFLHYLEVFSTIKPQCLCYSLFSCRLLCLGALTFAHVIHRIYFLQVIFHNKVDVTMSINFIGHQCKRTCPMLAYLGQLKMTLNLQFYGAIDDGFITSQNDST